MLDNRLDYVFDFLTDLKANNNRPWIHSRVNEKRLDLVKRTWNQFIALLMLDMQHIEDTHGLRPKNCVFRIWRGARFSKDKTPCKTYLSAVICKGGRNNPNRAAYYLQIGPGGQSFVGGGIYMPEPEQRDKIRKLIAKDGAKLAKATAAKPFRHMFGDLMDRKLKTMPRAYYKAKFPPAVRELIRNTSWVVRRDFSDGQVLNKSFEGHLIKVFETLKPFNDFLNHALS